MKTLNSRPNYGYGPYNTNIYTQKNITNLYEWEKKSPWAGFGLAASGSEAQRDIHCAIRSLDKHSDK